jgi:catechol 2,3-dioxygenase-like lactoylglutathione lyase family enzyme
VAPPTMSKQGPSIIEHVGITVPDVVGATRFFEAVFEAKIVGDLIGPPGAEDDGERDEMLALIGRLDLDALFGASNLARFQAVRVLSLGSGAQVELFQFDVDGQGVPVALTDLGCTHIGIQVDDIDAVAARIVGAGGDVFEGPLGMLSPDSDERNRFIYTRAPWGMLIELVMYPTADLEGS